MSEKFIQKYDLPDVKILSQETTFQGYFKVAQYKLTHRLFNGKWSPPLLREVFEREDASAILPFDPVQNKIILIEQFRIGALRNGNNPWLFELVAGMLNKGETAEESIHREMQEETGLTLLDFVPITTFFSTPGASSEQVSLFCGKVNSCDAKGFHGLAHEDEDIAVHVFELNDVYEALNSGIIKNSFTLIALQWLKLHENEIRQHFTR